jgi:3-hydroxyacyl-[acyl-carrier-protein] dehydratase
MTQPILILGNSNMNNSIDIKKIFSLIPHRYPILLVDRVIDYKVMDHLTAIKNVTINDNFFTGHFPGNPVMPGVLILEALAQASAILSNLSRQPKEGYEFLHLFAGIDNAKFKQVVIPGDQLRLEVKLVGQKRDFWRIHAEAYVDDKLACSADLLSAAKEILK